MDNNSSLFIVEAIDSDGEKFIYEYGNIKHAREHYDQEAKANLYEYNQGKHYFIDAKGEFYQ